MPDQPAILDLPVSKTALLREAMRGIAAYTRHHTLPLDCINELWQRLWPCIAFQNFYSRILANSFAYLDADADDFDDEDIDIEENYMSQMHLWVIAGIAFCRAPAENTLEPCVTETSGIRRVVAKIWSHVIRDDRTRRTCAEHLGHVVARMLEWDVPGYHDEIVKGAGGTELDLGRLIVDHMAGITEDVNDGELTYGQFKSIWHGLNFFQIRMDEGRGYIIPHGALKVVTRLATALQPWINNHSEDNTLPSRVLLICITFICENLRCEPGIDGVVDALAAGLLPLITRHSAPMDDSPHPHDCAESILGWHLDILNHWRGCVIWDSFSTTFTAARPMDPFMDLAHERIKIKAEFDTEYVPLKFCDNLKVTSAISDPKSSDAAIHSAVKPPERLNFGAVLAAAPVCESPVPDTISPRSLAFMRYLVHHDYLRVKKTAYLYRLLALFQDSGGPCYITFDYTSGKVALKFESTDKWPPVDVLSRSYEVKYPWKETVERAEDAKGELNLDVMLFPDGIGKNYRVFPMRCSYPIYHARMKELHEQRERGEVAEGECYNLIRALVDGLGNTITELHW
ncbi:hypothetical protein R3P38DRAFT_3208624 [Favolaschia claudopus]|uniref:Uncharacterized protein n=1 Tax=Favolaschia claudopus TaxID=2862362 RepID=A0AAW0AI78_9AGAR